MRNSNLGIVYQNTNQNRRSVIQGYHYTNTWNLNHYRGAENIDLRGMTPTQKSRVIDSVGGLHNCKYRVGFEVEKNYFGIDTDRIRYRDNFVGEQPLFRGYELDCSCGSTQGSGGVEAITHILPLLPKGMWRTKIFDMMHKAKHILNEETSGSNVRCGGHITLSVQDWSGERLFKAVRKYCGLIQSLYRMRLYKTEHQIETLSIPDYCNLNMTMSTDSYSNGNWVNAGYKRNLTENSKYSFCKLGGEFIEFRVPSRVTSEACMRLRYELFYELVDWAVKHEDNNTLNTSRNDFSKFIRKVKPIILRICGGDVEKANVICNESKYFQRFIDSNGDKRHDVVKSFMFGFYQPRHLDRRSRWIQGIWN